MESARVNDEVARQIEEAYIEDERAKSAAGSAAASVEVTALCDMTVEVGDQIAELAVNEVSLTLVEDEVVLTIPDVARMRVRAGPESKGLGRVHTKRSASKMSANEMNPRKITSSFSKREKMRRNPFNRRNSLSISLRLLYISRSYSHG